MLSLCFQDNESASQQHAEETQKAAKLIDNLEGKLSLAEQEKLQLNKVAYYHYNYHDNREYNSRKLKLRFCLQK
jgi:hypothetical protein